MALEISQRAGLPVTHLDVLFWGPDWKPAPVAPALRKLRDVVAGEQWVVEGNFLDHAAADGRFDVADTVILLDLHPVLCLWRALRRLARDRHRRRPDLPEGCAESFDPGLLRWIWRYRRVDLPRALRLLDDLGPRVDVRVLRSRAQVRRFRKEMAR